MTFTSSNKRPRQYAAEIVKLKTREERRAALERVPPIYRETVMTHVTNTLKLAWHWRKRIDDHPRAHVPECVRTMLQELEI